MSTAPVAPGLKRDNTMAVTAQVSLLFCFVNVLLF